MSTYTLAAQAWLVELVPLLQHISCLSIPTSMAEIGKTIHLRDNSNDRKPTRSHHLAIDLIVPVKPINTIKERD